MNSLARFSMRGLAATATIALTLAFGHTAVVAQQTYVLDDGTAENAVGFNPQGGGPGDIIALNSFATGALSTITSISIAWGFPGATQGLNMNGTSFTAVLWSDPNGDGLPGDAVVLATAPGVISGFNTNTFMTVSLTPTTVLTPNFFVGFIVTQPNPAFPAAFDQTAPTFSNRSFVAGGNGGTGNINNLNSNGVPVAAIESFNLIGNWMIRANAIPEPSTYMLTACGVLGLLGLRKFGRRKKN